MRIKLIQPTQPRTVLGEDFYYTLPPLGLMQLAGCTPPGHDIEILDECMGPIDISGPADLVGITVMTPNAPRAYEISKSYRERGVPVVLGGVHATMMEEEAVRHADSVVLGEADWIWPKVVEDAEAGRLEPTYRGPRNMALEGLPRPRRDLVEGRGYPPIHFVETTRGCMHNCEFCTVTAYWGGKYRSKPIDEVIAELESLKPLTTRVISIKNMVFFVDDNIASNHEYAAELFQRIMPLRLNWFGQASIELAENEELLDLCARSGCRGLVLGIESINPQNLGTCKKLRNVDRYRAAIERFHEKGIGIEGSFILGFEEDDEKTFDRIYSFAVNARLDSVYIGIMTPYPGTRLHRKMERAGRIVTREWSRYNTSQVVFRHKHLTALELQRGYVDLYRRLFSGWSIARRCAGMDWHRLQFFLPMNVVFRKKIYACGSPTFQLDAEPAASA